MKGETIKRAARAALPHTIPILAGFLFVGIAYGIFMRSLGFPAWYPIVMSVLIFAGSMQFVAGNLLTQPFDPVNALVLTLLVNARHLFYGLAMLERYGGRGKKTGFLIFSLCDETFSVNVGAAIPPQVDKGWFYFFVSLFNYLYWQVGSGLGALWGEFLQFDTDGLVFVMTALFLVIFVNRWLQDEEHIPALCGLGVSVVALGVFGGAKFIPFAMIGMLALLAILRPKMERRGRL